MTHLFTVFRIDKNIIEQKYTVQIHNDKFEILHNIANYSEILSDNYFSLNIYALLGKNTGNLFVS